jgi:hypothetical protein
LCYANGFSDYQKIVMFTLTCSKTVRSKGSHADVNALFCVCAGWSIHQLAKRTANKRLPSHIPAGDFGFSRFLSPGAHLFRTHEWLRFRFRFRSAAADGLINGRERERETYHIRNILETPGLLAITVNRQGLLSQCL